MLMYVVMSKRRYDEHDDRHLLPDRPTDGAPFWGENRWRFLFHCLIAAGVVWFIFWIGFPDWVRDVIDLSFLRG